MFILYITALIIGQDLTPSSEVKEHMQYTHHFDMSQFIKVYGIYIIAKNYRTNTSRNYILYKLCPVSDRKLAMHNP